MILVNTSVNSVNSDFHFVPTVHLQNTDRAAVKAYAATPGATATINQATLVYDAPAPYTASFSSRGPAPGARGDLLKPDLMAPGQDILAAVAPPGNSGRDFDLYSGTSMSSPHVAGLAALLMDLHPDWTPMMIKSALMTSAYDVLDGPNTNPLVIFRQGAGHVKPNSAADPGLVFDSGWTDWLGFLCGTQLPASYCTDTRHPGRRAQRLQRGLDRDRRPPRQQDGDPHGHERRREGHVLVLLHRSRHQRDRQPGHASRSTRARRRRFTITITRTTAALNAYTGGQLTWSDGTHTVRIPVVARPVALAAPAEVSGSYDVTFGYDGAFTAAARGLVPAAITPGTVADDPTDSTCSLASPNAQLIRSRWQPTPPTRASAVRCRREPRVRHGPVRVQRHDPGRRERLRHLGRGGEPRQPDGRRLHGRRPGLGRSTDTSPFKLHTWLLGSTAAGNMTVTAPASATFGSTGTIGLAFSGLTAGTKYLGSVAYSGATGMPNPTIVRVDP